MEKLVKRKVLSLALVLVLMLALVPVIVADVVSEIIVREVVSGLEYDLIVNFSEGLAIVLSGEGENRQTGVIDTTGNIVIPYWYISLNRFFKRWLGKCAECTECRLASWC